MNKNLIRTATAAIGLAATLGGLAACGVESSPSFTLAAFHGLKVETDSCTYTEDLRGGGLFDALVSSQSGSPYVLYLELQNNLASNEDESSHRLNTNKIQLTEIEVSYQNEGAWSFLPKKTRIPAGAVIDTNGSLFISVGAMDKAFADLALTGKDGVASPIGGPNDSSELLLTFKAKGRMGDGTDIESNELDYTVSICNGCMMPMCNVEAACALAQPDGIKCAEETAP